MFSLLICLSKVFLPHFVQGLHGASGTHLAGEEGKAGWPMECLARGCKYYTEEKGKDCESLENVVGWSLCTVQKIHNLHFSLGICPETAPQEGQGFDVILKLDFILFQSQLQWPISLSQCPGLLGRRPGYHEALPARRGDGKDRKRSPVSLLLHSSSLESASCSAAGILAPRPGLVPGGE